MINNTNEMNKPIKQISKIVTFYTDGTFTEFTPSPYMPTPYPQPYPSYPAPYTWPNNWGPNTIMCGTENKK